MELLPSEAVNNNGRAGVTQTNLPPTITSCHGGGEKEKEVLYWERRSAVLKKMVLGFQQARKCFFIYFSWVYYPDDFFERDRFFFKNIWEKCDYAICMLWFVCKQN